MPHRSHSDDLNFELQPPYPDWSDEMNETTRDFADQMAPSDQAGPPSRPTIVERVSATSIAAVDCASAMVDNAARSARSMARDLEIFARRQPLSALAGALLIGVVLGMVSRRRA